MRGTGIAALASLLSATGVLAQGLWEVDSARVDFEIRNAGLPVHGSIGGLEALICFDPADGSGNIRASLDPSTIDTGIRLRDRHLVRHGYFDVAKFGRIEMRSLGISGSDGHYRSRFLLRIRDVEREVDVPFEFEAAGERATMAGTLHLNRLDWGVGERSVILSDEVLINVILTLHMARGMTACVGTSGS